jgi:hypothetical protein
VTVVGHCHEYRDFVDGADEDDESQGSLVRFSSLTPERIESPESKITAATTLHDSDALVMVLGR